MAKLEVSQVDWKICAEALNKKINLIAQALKDGVPSEDIVREFRLDGFEHYPHFDSVRLVQEFDSISEMVHQLWFVSLSKRSELQERLQKSCSDFSFNLSLTLALLGGNTCFSMEDC